MIASVCIRAGHGVVRIRTQAIHSSNGIKLGRWCREEGITDAHRKLCVHFLVLKCGRGGPGLWPGHFSVRVHVAAELCTESSTDARFGYRKRRPPQRSMFNPQLRRAWHVSVLISHGPSKAFAGFVTALINHAVAAYASVHWTIASVLILSGHVRKVTA